MNSLWSVRMRAAAEGTGRPKHLSGAERLVSETGMEAVVQAMLARAQGRSPDKIQITIERVPSGGCHWIPCLPVQTVITSRPNAAATVAAGLLAEAGVAPAVAQAALSALQTGLGPGGTSLRGASLWDLQTGTRLERDPERGVRTSRFDYADAQAAQDALDAQGLTHFRTREALAVATKTLWAGVAAELCWSDEPDYTTGYVATPCAGYVRLPDFKPEGACGGRIFFLDAGQTDLETCLRRLERAYVVIESPTNVSAPVSAAEFRHP